MAHKDYYTNIMLDLECATPNFPDPVIIELAAVCFDIDTGAELDHYSTIVNFDSCKRLGLKQDESTRRWLNSHIPRTLDASIEGGKPLSEALSEFKDFVQRSCQATRERIEMQSLQLPRDAYQPMIWGNGAVADNVWISSAYRACNIKRPWEFYNDMCVRTFVKQANMMTGRDFKKEVPFQGQPHLALNDCRHQIAYLVEARNALRLLSQPIVKTKSADPELISSSVNEKIELDHGKALPTPETSFSSVDLVVAQVFASTATSLDEFDETSSEHEAFLEIITSSQEVPQEIFDEDPVVLEPIVSSSLLSPETSFSSADGDLDDILRRAASSLVDTTSSDHTILPDEQDSIIDSMLERSASASPNGHNVRDAPSKVTMSASPGKKSRRGVQGRTPRQLITPENSFTADGFEKEAELGEQQDQHVVNPQG